MKMKYFAPSFPALAVFLGLLVISVLLMLAIIIRNKVYFRKRKFNLAAEKEFLEDLIGPEFNAHKYKKMQAAVMNASFRLLETVIIDGTQRENIEKCVSALGLSCRIKKNLNSRSQFKVLYGIRCSSLLGQDEALLLLNGLLEKNISSSVDFFCSYRLSLIGDYSSIPLIIGCMKKSPQWMKYRYFSVLNNFHYTLLEYLTGENISHDRELVLLMIFFTQTHATDDFRKILVRHSSSSDSEIRRKACEAILKLYPEILMDGTFIKSDDPAIRTLAVKSFLSAEPFHAVRQLLEISLDSVHKDDAVNTMKIIIQTNPEVIPKLIDLHRASVSPEEKKMLIRAISGKIEYFTLKINSSLIPAEEQIAYGNIIIEILSDGNCSEFISFINQNTDIELELKTIPIVKKAAGINPGISEIFSINAKESYLQALGLEKKTYASSSPRKEKFRLGLLYVFLSAALLLFPAVYIIGNITNLSSMAPGEIFREFTVFYNYGFSIYSVSLNTIYLLILFLSLKGMHRQSSMWKYKSDHFLFQGGILPSVSIIAPAYGEENTIVESINSLLNLKYPDFEIIVVNDGSKDGTLKRLIEYYDLQRIETQNTMALKTAPIAGTYKNSRFPNLLVIDKINGGKADSLNTGINFADREYFCGIDADSLLESDALLKVTSQFLDSKNETIASGGNILPANNCVIDRGHLEKINIPSSFLARMQTVEYLRSFMTGRIGWSEIQGLLIISGAFGIFKKDEVIRAGGYLTEKSVFNKDTVGEDMELVVRLIKSLKTMEAEYQINYAFNANCWTEVPENYSVLKRQRDRWHRGLLDIITFHFDLLFNRYSKSVGYFAFPYFIIFEIIGPFFEVSAIFFFIAGILMKAVSSDLFLILFSSSILYGVIVTMTSILISEYEKPVFRSADSFRLAVFTVLESLGYRQVINFIRITGFFNALRQKSGWGKMQRKGFRKA